MSKVKKSGTGKSSKPKPNEGKSAERRTNWADVACRLIDALHDLAQTGNLLGLIIVGALLIIITSVFRMPSESLPPIYSKVIDFLIGGDFYFFPLSVLAGFSIIVNVVQYRVYASHIKTLTDHRSVLVHGLESGTLKPLDNHSTSGFDIQEQ